MANQPNDKMQELIKADKSIDDNLVPDNDEKSQLANLLRSIDIKMEVMNNRMAYLEYLLAGILVATGISAYLAIQIMQTYYKLSNH